MLDFLLKHYKKILVGLLLIVVIWVVNLSGTDDDYNLLESVVVDSISPVLQVSSSTQAWFQDTWRAISNYQKVKEENRQLKEEIAELKYNQEQVRKILAQNQRLRELLNFKQYTPYEVIGTSVIGYSPDSWTSGVIINRGEEAGLVSNLPVVAKEGYLAGVINKVSNYNSQVTLLNDPNFVIGGLVRREESRALGVVKGQSKEQSNLVMDNISWDADIQPDDIIVTSGLSENVPKGLPIGRVISVTPDDYGLTQSATLAPFTDLKKLEELLVISDYSAQPEEIAPPLEAYSELDQEGE